MITLRTLETFYLVAQLGGFHRAAEKLNTTQPAVSARITQLEQGLKVRLFERGRQGTTLTPKGRALMAYAERMLALRTEMILTLAGPTELSGRVQLGVSDTLVHTWLPLLVKRLHQDYPAITLEIIVDTSVNLTAGLADGSVDVALLLGPVNAPAVRNLPLCDYPLSWVVRADFPLTGGPVTLADIAAWPIITFARVTRPYRQLIDLFEKAGLYGVRMFANNSLSSIVRMTLDGIGISAIPRQVVAEELASGRLRTLESAEPMPSLFFTASYADRPDMPLNGIVADLAKQVAEGYA